MPSEIMLIVVARREANVITPCGQCRHACGQSYSVKDSRCPLDKQPLASLEASPASRPFSCEPIDARGAKLRSSRANGADGLDAGAQ
ncbi:hypothetical protein AOLI_G00212590 [Acnodon oligacanthus]